MSFTSRPSSAVADQWKNRVEFRRKRLAFEDGMDMKLKERETVEIRSPPVIIIFLAQTALEEEIFEKLVRAVREFDGDLTTTPS